MVPLALSGVTAVKVGHAYGAGKIHKIKEYTISACIIGVAFAVVSGAIFLAVPKWIFRIFTNQPEVITYGSALLLYVAIYQVPDALQEIFVGALRGVGATTIPFVLSFISIWLIGLSSGCYFAYVKEMGAAGLWLGLSSGLVFLGIFLATFFAMKIRRLGNGA